MDTSVHLIRVNQLLAVGVGVRTELINDNLVFRLNLDNFKHLNIVNSYLLKALVESIECLVQLPGDSLDLEVHIMEAVSGLSGLLTNLGFVYSGQFICILAEHSIKTNILGMHREHSNVVVNRLPPPGHRMTVIAECAHGSGADKSWVHAPELHNSLVFGYSRIL